MPAPDYTTTIDAEKTLAEIHRLLAKAGARRISVDYDDRRQPAAVTFTIQLPFGDFGYRLPANARAVYDLLERQWQDGQMRRGFVTPVQASRVSWRIVKDWLEAQIAIIEAGLVTLDRVFLPYAVVALRDGSEGTFYDAWCEHQGGPLRPDRGPDKGKR